MLIIDDFLRNFEELRNHCDKAKFGSVVNPVDGVSYPYICSDIPEHIAQEIFELLGEIKGAPIVKPTMFLRLSPAGVYCPHEVHSDASMGAFSLMLYLNREEDCQGGTSLVSHRDTGIAYHPGIEPFEKIVRDAQNIRSAWDIRSMIDMKPNRAFVFDASALHRAEPPGGFGVGNEHARLVLTCFFS
jgi:hypothetical protein